MIKEDIKGLILVKEDGHKYRINLIIRKDKQMIIMMGIRDNLKIIFQEIIGKIHLVIQVGDREGDTEEEEIIMMAKKDLNMIKYTKIRIEDMKNTIMVRKRKVNLQIIVNYHITKMKEGHIIRDKILEIDEDHLIRNTMIISLAKVPKNCTNRI